MGFLGPLEYDKHRLSQLPITFKFVPNRKVYLVIVEDMPVASIADHIFDNMNDRERYVIAKIYCRIEKKYCEIEEKKQRLLRKYSTQYKDFAEQGHD